MPTYLDPSLTVVQVLVMAAEGVRAQAKRHR